MPLSQVVWAGQGSQGYQAVAVWGLCLFGGCVCLGSVSIWGLCLLGLSVCLGAVFEWAVFGDPGLFGEPVLV